MSDSFYGISAYSYTDTYAGINTSAQKAWFFFDDEVVCLGAGIHSTADNEVNTTINQCLLAADKKALIHVNGKQSAIENGSFTYNSPQWILHNDIAYLFPNGGNIFISSQRN